MAATWTEFRRNQERDAQEQINAGNFGAPQVEEVANGIPSNGNEAALAAHLKETRDKSAEYARLQTEADRQIWEQAIANNFRKDQDAANAIKTQAAVETMNRSARDRAEGERLFSELNAVQKGIPADQNEWTVSLDKLRDVVNTTQKIANLTGVDLNAPQQSQALPYKLNPKPFDDGKLYQMDTSNPNEWKVKLATGEEFSGDPLSVTQKLAEAKVNTAVWARGKVLEAMEHNQPTAQTTNQTAAQPTNQADDIPLSDALAAHQADVLAKRWGYSNEAELVQDYQHLRAQAQKVEQFERQQAATQFFTQHPEFPGTDEAVNAVAQIVDAMNLPETAEAMAMAHSFALSRGMYQPLSAEAVQASYGTGPATPKRPTAPPMLRSSNPEITMQTPDPYSMNLAELRKAAIAQELTGGGRR